jgi:uncharacterized protein
MSDLTIYNCHCHTFTTRHVPRDFLKLLLGPVAGPMLSSLLSWKPAAQALLWLARRVDPFSHSDVIERQAAFFTTGNVLTQREVFASLERQYPADTVFVVLPIDLTFFNLGPVAEPIDWQHDDLLALAAEYPGRLLPFYAVDPRHPEVLKNARRWLGRAPGQFCGVKLYPNGGYAPNDDKLLGIYALCEERGLPVMAHCSSIGLGQYGLTPEARAAFSHPRNYEAILTKFPQLRLCLAHFGGSGEWDRHLQSEAARTGPDRDWVRWIADLIRDGVYPNLYTDISYTLFQMPSRDIHVSYLDYLKVLLTDEHLRTHVLYGSDYYMVTREPLTEKELSIQLRSRLGEDLYFQIAHHNPRRYLGLD